MVRPRRGPTGYKVVARRLAPEAGSPPIVVSGPRPAARCRAGRCRDRQRLTREAPYKRRAGRRRVDRGQVRRHGQALADVPAGPVEHENGLGPGRHRARQLGQEDAHRRGRDLGQHRGHALAALGTHGAEQVGGGEALLAHPARAHASGVPDVGDAPLLADPGLVHDPRLDPSRLGMPGGHLADQRGQVLLKRSCAFGSASGWTGRAFCQDRWACQEFRVRAMD